ncbi:MAG TPA: TM2 domain-containing protein [Acidobacteriota bacterium]|nr:TM2 domain-containing protein [Acidobacteriota bacterium]HNT17128.1 TM2 domain-containing protein [Acidobacteriota bacterium]
MNFVSHLRLLLTFQKLLTHKDYFTIKRIIEYDDKVNLTNRFTYQIIDNAVNSRGLLKYYIVHMRREEMNQCPNCGAGIKPGTTRCMKCGTTFAQQVSPESPPPYQAQQPYPPQRSQEQFQYQQAQTPPKSKMAFILLGIFLGTLGIHNFYAGYTGKGVVQLLISVCTCGYGAIISWIWAIVEVCTVTVDSQGRPFSS